MPLFRFAAELFGFCATVFYRFLLLLLLFGLMLFSFLLEGCSLGFLIPAGTFTGFGLALAFGFFGMLALALSFARDARPRDFSPPLGGQPPAYLAAI